MHGAAAALRSGRAPCLDSQRLGRIGGGEFALDGDGALGAQQHQAGNKRQDRDAQRPPVGRVEGTRVRQAAPQVATVPTAKERTTDPDSLAALASALSEAVRDTAKVSAQIRTAEDLRNGAVFQFGAEGSALLEGVTFRGRYPNVRVHIGGRQIGMFTDLGKMSLTLDGGAILSERNLHCVEIEDFWPEGSVFAVGVTGADDRIRVGDEVVVRHRGEVRAVGVAAMNPKEMVDLHRGEAVKVRHRAAKKV